MDQNEKHPQIVCRKIELKKTQEILIRTAKPTDLEAVWTGLSTQPDSFYRFIPNITRKRVESWYSNIDLKKIHPINCFIWNSPKQCEDNYVGNCTIEYSQDDRLAHVVKLGIHILTEFQGMGIASAFGEVIYDYLHHQTEIRKAMVEVVNINHRSLNLVKKFGLQEEGCLKGYWYSQNQYNDVFLLSLNLKS